MPESDIESKCVATIVKEGERDFGVGDVDAVIEGVGATVQRAEPAAFICSVVPLAQGSVLNA